MVRSAILSWALRVLLALATVVVLGCPPSTPKTATAKRPIDDGRAAKIIAESLRKEGLEPGAAKKVSIPGGGEIAFDLTVVGRRFGIAYLSAEDITALGNHPIAQKKHVVGDPLRIETTRLDGAEVHFLVLYSSDYLSDDLEGVEHESTVIAAENKLDRDVRDFIMITRREHIP